MTTILLSNEYVRTLLSDEVIEGAGLAYRRYLDLTRKRSEIRGYIQDKAGERKDLLKQAQEAHTEFNMYKGELDRRIFDQGF
ncbi:MAG TPA: hypothetical protein VJA47_05695 [archaeon]|nr:hypothetical protein [archaeon]